MSDLARKRCFHHAAREAAARCPTCGRFFCRECITEHEDRVICASCLRTELAPPGRTRGRLGALLSAAQLLAGTVALWLAFYALGRGLLEIPTDFHEGALWETWKRPPGVGER